MNKVVVGAAVLVVVAGGGVAAAGWSGGKVADELHAQTAKALESFPGVKVVEHRVSKGLMSSTHEVTIEAGCATVPAADAPAGATPSGPFQLTWRDRISHGPVPGGRAVGLAVIDSELVLPPQAAAAVAKLMGDKDPFTVRTTVGFGGSYVARFDSPAFKYTEAGKGDFDWQGVTAVVRGNLREGSNGTTSYTVDAPGLLLTAAQEGSPPTTLKIGSMSLKGDISGRPDASLWFSSGKGSGSIASLEFSVPRPGAAPDAKPFTVAFDGMQFTSDSKLDNGLLSTATELSGKARVDDFSLDKVEMQVSLRRLHAATYQQIVRRVMAAAFSCDKAAKKSFEEAADTEMMKGMAALLQHNPEYSLDKLAVEMSGQRAELSYVVGTRGVTVADAETPLPLLFSTKGFGTASIKVQTGFIEQVTKKLGAMQAAATGAGTGADAQASVQTAQTQMMAMANMMIDQGAAGGYLVREGDVVKSHIKFEGGRLLLNDKPLDLPVMGAK